MNVAATVVLIALGGVADATRVNRPAVVAHRGLAGHAPENTLACFRACLELQVGIELDVRRSKDGPLVCLHDDTLDRTTSGKGKVGDATLAELKKLDAGSWFDPVFKGETVPALDEVFALLARQPRTTVWVAIDLKEADTEADVVGLAKKHGVLDRLHFIGRSINTPEVRQRLRKADGKAHVACLADPAGGGVAAALKDADSDWVYTRQLPSKEEMARIHAAGKRVFIAGPLVAGEEPAHWRKAADLGIDAILTDYPLELAALLRPRKVLGKAPGG